MFRNLFVGMVQRMRKLRMGIIAFWAVSAIVLMTVAPVSLLAQTTIPVSVEPATRAVPVNGTLTVDIVADSTDMAPSGLGGYEFDLVFDSDYLEYVSIADGGDLDSGGQRTVVELGPRITTTTSITVSFGAYSYEEAVDQASGPAGSVVLATVELKAKRGGVTTVDLENVKLADTQGVAWPDEGNNRYLNPTGSTVWGVIDASSRATNFNGDNLGDPGLWDPERMRYKWKEWDGSQWNLRYDVVIGPSTGIPVVGDFNGDGSDEPGIWDPDTLYYKWKVWNGSSWDLEVIRIGPSTAIPVVGDFNGDGLDDPGVWDPERMRYKWKEWDGSQWNLRYDVVIGPSTGIPVVGDFNGDGSDEPGIWDPDTLYYKWKVWNGSSWDLEVIRIGPSTATPVVGDFNGDGLLDDPGVWDPERMRYKWKEWDGSQWNLRYDVVIGPSTGLPVAGDFNGDDWDEPGIWDPDTLYYKWKVWNGSSWDLEVIRIGPSTSVPLD